MTYEIFVRARVHMKIHLCKKFSVSFRPVRGFVPMPREITNNKFQRNRASSRGSTSNLKNRKIKPQKQKNEEFKSSIFMHQYSLKHQKYLLSVYFTIELLAFLDLVSLFCPFLPLVEHSGSVVRFWPMPENPSLI